MSEENYPFDLTIEKGAFQTLQFSCTKDGRRLSASSTVLPSSLRVLLRRIHSYQSIENDLITFLQEDEAPRVVYLKTRTKTMALKWDPTFVAHPVTTLSLTDDGIIIDRAVRINDDFSHSLLRVGKQLVVDAATETLGVIAHSETAWETYSEFDDDGSDVPSSHGLGQYPLWTHLVKSGFDPVSLPLILPLNVFHQHSFSFDFSEDNDALILYANNEATQARHVTPSYQIRCYEQKDEFGYGISPIAQVENDDIQLHHKLLDFFSVISQLPASLKTTQSRQWFFSAFLKLAEEKESSIDDVMSALKASERFKDDDVSKKVKRVLEDFRSTFESSTPVLQVVNSTWVLVNHNLEEEVNLYRVMMTVFFDHYVSTFQDGELRVSRSLFKQRFSSLVDLAKTQGITVLLGDRPTSLLHWDVDVLIERLGDAYSTSTRVSSGSSLIDQEIWASIIESDGFYEDGDTLKILDSATLEKLRGLLGVYSSQDDDHAKKKEQRIVGVPRLKVLDWIFLRQLGINVRLSEDDERVVRALSEFTEVPNYELPKHFKGDLRSYQLRGYHWLSFLYQHHFGACLADDMGLGKTVQAIVFLAAVREGIVQPISKKSSRPSRFLIVVPPSLLFNWRQELSRFYPDFNVMICSGGADLPTFDDIDVVITTYEYIRRRIDFFQDFEFDVTIFDEAQAVKNIYAGRTAAVRQLNSAFKVCLTGTPMENHLGEYFSIMDLVLPGLLGSYDEFQEVVKSGKESMLLQRSKPFVLRRKKSEILNDLPPKIENTVQLQLSDKQQTLYKGILAEVRTKVASAFKDKTEGQARIMALTAILRLRQLCVSPSLIDEKSDVDSPKISYLTDALKSLQDEGHHALVFSQFRTLIDQFEPILKDAGINVLRMDGKTPVSKRESLVKTFQESDEPSVFLISLKTGGVGLNLTRASYVYHIDPWWNPAVEDQASDRAHRIGQTQRVFVTRLVMADSIEEKMMVLKERKKSLFDQVVDGNRVSLEGLSLTKDDFDYLLSPDVVPAEMAG